MTKGAMDATMYKLRPSATTKLRKVAYSTLQSYPTTSKRFVLSILSFILFFYLISPFHFFSQQSTSDHPIPSLIHAARQEVARREQLRPVDLAQAVNDYIERNHRPPPLGFNHWYEMSQDSRCNQDYSELHRSLALWWTVAPQEIQRRMAESTNDVNNSLSLLSVSKRKIVELALIKVGNSTNITFIAPPRPRVRSQVEKLVRQVMERQELRGVKLPDFDMVINELREPRVIISNQLSRKVDDILSRGEIGTSPIRKLVFSGSEYRGDAYSYLKLACTPESLATQTPSTLAFQTAVGGFLASPHLERATWCDQSDIKAMHGAFISPVNFSITHQPFPIFSQAKLSGYNDILLPILSPKHRVYNKKLDRVWTRKLPKIFWRGENSGGFSDSLNWIGWHTSRVVTRFNKPSTWKHRESLILVSNSNSSIELTLPSIFINEALADIAFTSSGTEGQENSLQNQRNEPSFRFNLPEVSELYGSKMVLDLDSTSSSDQFMSLMQSNSAVVKSTIYMEALTESSLIAWYHYIPLSIRYTELYPLLGYFFSGRSIAQKMLISNPKRETYTNREMSKVTQSLAHDQELRAIATNGQEWAEECGGEESAIIYLYLLVLEWARVSSVDRDTNNYISDSK